MQFTSRGILRFSLFLSGYLLFLIIGASVFLAIEEPNESGRIQDFQNLKYNFLKKYPSVTDQAFDNLVIEISKHSKHGVLVVKNATFDTKWTFGQSLFFISTIVTTIGYGRVTPLSRNGKLFSIIYALVGIPLTLVLLSALVERLLVPTLWLLNWLSSKLGHLYEPFKIRLLHLMVILTILVVIFLAIPAAIFHHFESEWDYLDSIYYCFISLTTIGLGDYIPGETFSPIYRPLYKILTTAYLFLGITYMMLTLAVFYDIPQLNLGLLFLPSDDDMSEKARFATSVHGGYTSGGTYPVRPERNGRARSRKNDKARERENNHKL